MLHHWLIAFPKNPRAETAVVERISATLERFLFYRPDNALLHRFEQGCYAMSVSAGTDVWRLDPPFALSADGFLAVSGVPTLEAVKGANDSIPATLRRVIHRHGPDRVYQTVGGSFSVGCLDVLRARRLRVQAFSDFSGYSSVFYLDSPDYFAVGNRASFVGALAGEGPDGSNVDADVLSWLPGTTMIMGTKTAFRGVSRLRTGYRISLTVSLFGRNRRVEVDRMSPHHFVGAALRPAPQRRWNPFSRPDPPPPQDLHSVDYEGACDRMAARVDWCVSRGIGFRAHLTGGRDTRVIAGVLASRRAAANVERFSSLGTEENGDVIVARMVAERLGLRQQHIVAPGGKAVSTLSAEELHTVLRRSTFVYDGHLTAWDGRRQLVRRVPSWVTLMGGGGEIYRQEWGSSDALADSDGPQRALSMFSRHDVLRLLSDSAREYQLETVKRELALLRDEGAVNLACAFYMEERLANWGCGHFSNGLVTQFPLLLDRELAEVVFGFGDVAEDVHFELLRHCGHDLLSVPFLNKEWAPRTEQRARSLGLAPTPIAVPAERSFPWQFACYRTYRNAIIDFCLECGDALRDQVPASSLEDLKRRPIEPFGSAHAKMLFGLCGAICLITGASHGNRDLINGEPIQMSGNETTRIRDALEEDSLQSHDVADRLRQRLHAAAPSAPETA